MNIETEVKIDGLVNQSDLRKLRESAQYIIDDLMDEGFDYATIKAYLKKNLWREI